MIQSYDLSNVEAHQMLNQNCLTFNWKPVINTDSLIVRSEPRPVVYMHLEEQNNDNDTDRGENWNKKRILIVDDQSFNIDALMIILEYAVKVNNCQFICDKANNGKRALDMIIQDAIANEFEFTSYILVLMDCNMPFMDGYESTDKIRQFLYDNNIQQPIITAVTGHSEETYVCKALQSGMNQVLSKPIQIDVLKYLIVEILNMKTKSYTSHLPNRQFKEVKDKRMQDIIQMNLKAIGEMNSMCENQETEVLNDTGQFRLDQHSQYTDEDIDSQFMNVISKVESVLEIGDVPHDIALNRINTFMIQQEVDLLINN